MRIILIVICLFIFSFSHSQKITVEQDKFLKAKRIETGWCTVTPKLLGSLSIRLRSVDTTIFITLAGGIVGADVIGSTDIAIFLLDDKSTFDITSTGIQSYDIGQYGNSFRHQYTISFSNLELLKDHLVTSIRKYGSDSYHDFDVKEKDSKKLKDLVIRFIKEFNQ